MAEPTIPLIDWQRLRYNNPIRTVLDAILIAILVCIGFLVLMCLRAYCLLWRGGHVWQHFPGDDFNPAMDSECSCCGATKPHEGPTFRDVEWD